MKRKTFHRFIRSLTARALFAAGIFLVLGAPGAAAPGEKEPRFVPGRVLVKFKGNTDAREIRDAVSAVRAREGGEIPGIGVRIIQLPRGAVEHAAARAFKARGSVDYAELDEVLEPDSTPNDPSYPLQWHLAKMGGPTAWSTTSGAPSVIIAILDSGVDGSHPDLAPNLVTGWNFYSNNSDTSDVTGHGTAVAGCAAAVGNNALGVASPAYGCRIMPLRISAPSGSASLSTMATALTWAADHGARVANLSYRASTSPTVQGAAQYFQGKGGVVCISAGNYALVSGSPDNPYVLTVSGTDSNDNLASFSDSGTLIDVAAPAVNVYTTNRGGGYGGWTGTSFSAPCTAGIAALVISVNPGLSGAQVQDVIKRSAADRGTAGWDPTYGWGRVDAAAAVSLARDYSGGGPTPTEPTSPPPLEEFAAPTVTITGPAEGHVIGSRTTNVTVTVRATDDVGVVRTELFVDGELTATSTTAPFTMKWNTKRLAAGTHTLQCFGYDAAGKRGESPTVRVSR